MVYYFILQKQKKLRIIKNEGDLNIQELRKEEKNLAEEFNLALGYTRYATSYKNAIKDKKFYIQPFKGNQINLGDFYLLHNGNLDKEYLCALFDIDIKEK